MSTIERRGGARARPRRVVARVCPTCTLLFDAWASSGPFKTRCSARCRAVASSVAATARRPTCPAPRCDARPQGRTCPAHRPRRHGYHGPSEIECRICQAPLAVGRTGGGRTGGGRTGGGRLRLRYCSALCQNRAAKKRRYDAGSRRHFPVVRYSQRQAIFERDGWRCGICGAVIDRTFRWPHPGSPSIDHVDPNGAHEPANWQASHLACNVAKGAQAA